MVYNTESGPSLQKLPEKSQDKFQEKNSGYYC